MNFLKKISSIFLSLIIIFILCFFLIQFILTPLHWYISPCAAFDTFQTRQCTEGQINNPLVVSGEKVIPILEKKIKNRKMKRRGYAIRALGEIGSRDSIPVLLEILMSDIEETDFKQCALYSILLIDFELGIKMTKFLFDKGESWIKKDYLEYYSKNIKPPWLIKKTYWEAWSDKLR